MITQKHYQTPIFGGKDYAVLPRDEYEALGDAVDEGKTDITVARRVLGDADGELVPFEFAERIAVGVHPVRAWRDYCGMNASNLATENSIV